MTDELPIPQVPDAKPDDPEDVSWALSTADAMWARGDHAEGLKWVRRAAEAASEAEKDNRALELAKAAADLQGVITRMSQADKGSDRALKPPPLEKPAPSSLAPASSRSVPPTSRSVPPTSRSVPPIGRASVPPVGRTSVKPAPPGTSTPPAAPTAGKASSRSVPPRSVPPIAAAAQARPSTPPKVPSKAPEKKGRRKSRENLEAEAKAAGVLDTARQTAITADTAEVVALSSDEAMPLRPKAPYESDATVVAARRAGATASITGADVIDDDEHDAGDRKTAIGSAPTGVAASPGSSRAAPRSVPPRAPTRTPSMVPHDQSIQTSQAIRVVVWRDANGVHVAPAGTVVSAIKIDAMLVALEPAADLTAWLSPKTR